MTSTSTSLGLEMFQLCQIHGPENWKRQPVLENHRSCSQVFLKFVTNHDKCITVYITNWLGSSTNCKGSEQGWFVLCSTNRGPAHCFVLGVSPNVSIGRLFICTSRPLVFARGVCARSRTNTRNWEKTYKETGEFHNQFVLSAMHMCVNTSTCTRMYILCILIR